MLQEFVCTFTKSRARWVDEKSSIIEQDAQVGVTVNIPLSEEDLCWLRKYQVSVNQLNNSEISAFVGDQILGLNLGNCRGARLVGYDYQSRTCEVTPHYLNIVRALVLDAFKSLKTKSHRI